MNVKFLIIEDATPEELSKFCVDDFFKKDKTAIVAPVNEHIDIKDKWVNHAVFDFEMQRKGYKPMRDLATKKRNCDKLGIAYKKFGKEFMFENAFDRIPERKKRR